MTTYEDFFSPSDVATFKRVKHGQMHLSRVARRVLADMVGGTISPYGKELVETKHGLWRLAMAENSDNSTEREAYERMGATLVVMGSRDDVTWFFAKARLLADLRLIYQEGSESAVKVGRKISIGYDELTEREWQKLFNALTFVNGDGDIVECWRQVFTRHRIDIPRGAWNLVSDLDYIDNRVKPVAPELKFTVQLDDTSKDERFGDQSKALASMLAHEQGQVIRPPGTGKSQIVLGFVAQCKTTCLVIVHTEDILNQWIRYANEALPEIEVGVIRGPVCEIRQLTIGTVQTLRRYINKDFWQQFGAIIADEAHHGAAPTWETIMNLSPAFYRFGMTASETRADGMHPALNYIIGPVIHKQKFSSPVKLSVMPVRSNFYYGFRGPFDWMPMLNKLVTDDKRNQQIARVANDETSGGNSVLILSRRIEHLERIAEGIEGRVEILTGKRSRADRKRILDEFRSGELQCLAATQLADEALDVPRLNRVILTHPGKHEGRLIQQIGRAIRQHPGKQDAVIYDVMDSRVGVLRRQWAQRKQAYKKSGIKVRKLGRLRI